MKQPNIKQAKEFAQLFGVKAVIYGPPGGGKTPLIGTAPNPVLMLSEPGTRSLKGCPIKAFMLDSDPLNPEAMGNELDEYREWFQLSNEAKQYDTWAFDSISQMAEIYLARAHKKNKDGRAAYGVMADDVLKWTNFLYYTRQKHIVLLAKNQLLDTGLNRPYFPGKELNTAIPHLYDVIARLALCNVPGVGQVKALRTLESFDTAARDRSGELAEYEQPNLTQLFTKVMR